MQLPDLPRPTAAAIDRFSPSLVNALTSCELRVAYQRDPAFATWRRPNTFSALGELAHSLWQSAVELRTWPEDEVELRRDLEERWDRAAIEQAAHLAERWRPATPPPIQDWPGYHLTRVRTVRGVMAHLLSRDAARHGGGREAPKAETWLEDEASGLHGRLDRLEHRADGVRVVDLKAGLSQEEPTPDQRRQLLLYAVLVQRSTGTWPREVAIQDAAGVEHTIWLNPDEAEQELRTAQDRVTAFNERVGGSDEPMGQGVLADLASPSRDTCQWCPYRAVCDSYWQELSIEWDHRSVLGSIKETGETPTGTYAVLEIHSPQDSGTSTSHVAGLEGHPTRPAWLALAGAAGAPGQVSELTARWSSLVWSG